MHVLNTQGSGFDQTMYMHKFVSVDQVVLIMQKMELQ